jgi:hypothetical protein
MNKEDKEIFFLMFNTLAIGIKLIIALVGGKKSFNEGNDLYQKNYDELMNKIDKWIK